MLQPGLRDLPGYGKAALVTPKADTRRPGNLRGAYGGSSSLSAYGWSPMASTAQAPLWGGSFGTAPISASQFGDTGVSAVDGAAAGSTTAGAAAGTAGGI